MVDFDLLCRNSTCADSHNYPASYELSGPVVDRWCLGDSSSVGLGLRSSCGLREGPLPVVPETVAGIPCPLAPFISMHRGDPIVPHHAQLLPR